MLRALYHHPLRSTPFSLQLARPEGTSLCHIVGKTPATWQISPCTRRHGPSTSGSHSWSPCQQSRSSMTHGRGFACRPAQLLCPSSETSCSYPSRSPGCSSRNGPRNTARSTQSGSAAVQPSSYPTQLSLLSSSRREAASIPAARAW